MPPDAANEFLRAVRRPSYDLYRDSIRRFEIL
jgi:hypothetical protein